MNKKFLIFWVFVFLLAGLAQFQSCAPVDEVAGGVKPGVAQSVAGVKKDKIYGTNTDPRPGNDSIMNASYIGNGIIRLSWKKAEDDDTPSNELVYKVFYSTEKDSVIGVGNMLTYAHDKSLFFSTNAETIEYDINSLLPGDDYYFSVIVKDAAENHVAYSWAEAVMPPNTAPVPGNNGHIVTRDHDPTAIFLAWTAATDDFTPDFFMQYVVYYSKSNNITDLAGCETNGSQYGNYTSRKTSDIVPGLDQNTLYYFNVVAKDEHGLKCAYTCTQNTTGADDPPVAGNSGVISAPCILKTRVYLNWQYAEDDITNQEQMKYLLYYSSSGNISTVTQCETNGIPVGTWETHINTKSVSGLTSGTKYYFNVVAKDGAGFKCTYQMADFTTLTTDVPPVAGNSGTIDIGTVTTNSVTLSWTKATDAESYQENLEYLVYYSLSDNISTVANCEANGTPFGSYVKDISTKNITGLNYGTKYYFNLVVKDEGDNKICYLTANATTEVIPLAIGDLHKGGIIFYLNGSGGGMVCALTDQSTAAPWGCYGTALTGCSATAIGTGNANTNSIVAGCATAGIAAKLCYDYNDGIYSDWFLPSLLELNTIKTNIIAVNAGLVTNGGTLIEVSSLKDYWSSSQLPTSSTMGIIPPSGDDKNKAYSYNNTSTGVNKDLNLRVRAVRSF